MSTFRFFVLLACVLSMRCDQQPETTQVPLQTAPLPARYETWKAIAQKPAEPLAIDHLNQLIEPIAWIPLEASDRAFLSRVWEAALIGDLIFLLDFDLQVIHCFDRQGKFVTQVGRRGQGPGEYQQADGMISWQGQLVVSDSQRGKLLYYSVHGEILREVDTWRSGRGIGLSKHFQLQGSRLYVCNWCQRS